MERNEKDLERFQDMNCMNCMRLYKIINVGGGGGKRKASKRAPIINPNYKRHPKSFPSHFFVPTPFHYDSLVPFFAIRVIMPRDIRIPWESDRTVFVRINQSSVFIGFGCVCI